MWISAVAGASLRGQVSKLADAHSTGSLKISGYKRVMSKIFAGSCTCCARANVFPVYFTVNKYR